MTNWTLIAGIGSILVIFVAALSFFALSHRDGGGAGRPLPASANAEVLSMRDTGNRFNHNPQIELRLRVNPDAGEPFETATRTVVSPVLLSNLRPGSIVAVRYDPEARERVELADQP